MQKKSWKLRKARIDDASALSDCMHAAYGIYASRLMGKTLPPLTINYEEEIRDYPVWVVETDSAVIAGLILMPEEHCMVVANIAVHPRFQGKGVGRALMAHAEAETKKRDCREMGLATHVALTENIAFYARLGWAETGRDETRIYMCKSLA